MVTATCFGGPLDRKRVSCDGHVMVAAIPTHPRKWLVDELDYSPLGIRQGRYTAQKFAFGSLVWDAWCWDGGWIEDETVIRHIELGMQLMWEIARVTKW